MVMDSILLHERLKQMSLYPIFNKSECKTKLDPVTVCMPIHNEADVIESVIREWVEEVFQFLPEGSIFAFDEAGSNDGTNEILERLQKEFPFIHVYHHPKKDGFANAARRLYQAADTPLIFFTDCDGQYVASDFWKLVPFSMAGYDMVRGAKIGRRDPLFRRIASLFFNKAVQFLFSVNYMDVNSAFLLVQKEVMDKVLSKTNCMKTLINTEILLRTEIENFDIRQVYVLHRERQFGISRGLNPWKYLFECMAALKGLFRIKASYRR